MYGRDGKGLEIQLKTEQLRILFSIFSGKHINYSKPETECTLKQIMFLYLLRIIQNVESSSGNRKNKFTGKGTSPMKIDTRIL
jgi:hypothetical protein